MSEKAFSPAELNQGFVVAIQIVAKAGEEDIVANALQTLVKPTMAASIFADLKLNARSITVGSSTGN